MTFDEKVIYIFFILVVVGIIIWMLHGVGRILMFEEKREKDDD
jgi:uncharacterized integral membrane protein